LDYLEVDNQAWTVRNAGDPQKILLVTDGNSFLQTLLARLPNYKTTKIATNEYDALKTKGDYNLFIFDEYAPDQLPSNGGIWLIGPPNTPYLPVTGTVKQPIVGRLEQNDPLLRYSDLTSIDIAEASVFELPGWAKVSAAADNGTPLIISGDRQGQRITAMSFNLHNSDLALRPAWPILLINTLGWLQPQGAVDAITEANPGEPVSFVAGSATEQISVTPPNRNAQLLKITNNIASFTDTGLTGIYQVTRRLDASPTGTTPAPSSSTTRNRVVNEFFVVNMFSPITSNIKPLDDLGLQGTVTAAQLDTASVKTERELWQPIALIALILLMLEWYIFYKGGLPFFKKENKEIEKPKIIQG
jgi:hypothetical protein